MINMFSLVHGRANFIPQATNIDHVNVLEQLSSKDIMIFEEEEEKGRIIEVCILYNLVGKYVNNIQRNEIHNMYLNYHCSLFCHYALLKTSFGSMVPSDLNKTL